MANKNYTPPSIWRGGESENYNPMAPRELPPEYQPQARSYQGGAGAFVPDANDQPGEDLLSTLRALMGGAALGPMANTDPDDPRIAAIQKYSEMMGGGQMPAPSTQMLGGGMRGKSLREMTPMDLEDMVLDMNSKR